MELPIEEYYRKYGAMVMRRCRSILRDEDQALDAMQDTFVRLLKYKKRLTGQAPSSLLYTIATNVCLNKIRTSKRRPTEVSGEILETVAATSDHAEAAVAKHFTERLFATQLAGTDTIATLHYVDGLTLEETAEATGMSVSGVRKRLRNLRARGLELKER